MTITDYLNLITSAYREKPKFIATVSLDVSVQVRVQELLLSMIPIFDLDIAVGDQLDIIGQWVGISRNVSIPIPNVYFSWDADYTLGWDYGSWQPALSPTSVTSLPDDAYRLVIKAKIAANNWNGTTPAAYAIWEQLFPQYVILIQDNQNMTYDLIILGGIVDSLTLALLNEGYISLKPEGVRIAAIYTAIDTGPVFGWDLDNGNIEGWDQGTWAIQS